MNQSLLIILFPHFQMRDCYNNIVKYCTFMNFLIRNQRSVNAGELKREREGLNIKTNFLKRKY